LTNGARPPRLVVGVLLVIGLVAASATVARAKSEEPLPVTVSLDRASVSNRLGDSFSFRSTVANAGRTPQSGLVAHLNIVALTKGVYVDPEDWSSQRTRYLPDLAPGERTEVPWKVQSVNGGRFAVYVVVLPGAVQASPAAGPTVSQALDVRVTERKTINSGGVLPLAVGVPALLGFLTLGLRIRRDR
jgi:hypothetical protein